MDLITYQNNALRTEKKLPTPVERLVHASLGLATESGEMTTEVKRMAIYSKPLDEDRRAHLAEEIGDVMWYLAIAADALGMQLADIAAANISKLQQRFPDAYSDHAAEARADKGGLDARNS
ncbi:MazG-like nucleotide pyrophosphohydrolase family protein [Paucimonas lemoignei]|uniref:MazG-like nucleotide pyrophosphohydrolase family protein n=1 Tax=Paucimonas lemoignei TaxID=29443 RepID=A0A4V2UIT9_PAULE|nr:nucleoside triphosphate pyrophosphohydrolase family protein [Paucimonas lemoignei]TCS37460.1 MazG-like nucleotide pyrophosphohydrolase family protein [Paucimonas lemoignei]